MVDRAHAACYNNPRLYVKVCSDRGYSTHVSGRDSWFVADSSHRNLVEIAGACEDADSLKALLEASEDAFFEASIDLEVSQRDKSVPSRNPDSDTDYKQQKPWGKIDL